MQKKKLLWDDAVDVVRGICAANVLYRGPLPDGMDIDDVVSSVFVLVVEEFEVRPTAQKIRREIVREGTRKYLKRARDRAWHRVKRRPRTVSTSDVEVTTIDQIDQIDWKMDIFDLDLTPSELQILELLWDEGKLTTIELGEKLGIRHQRASELLGQVRKKLSDYFRGKLS